MDAKLCVEEARIECFRNQKNISIYTSFGRDRPMALINGYDGAVRSMMKRSDEAVEMHYKTY